jgi:uncharacterized membrane protein YdbT with pleckstrin-like domain
MSYVKKVLQPGETLVFATGLHWLTYLPSILLFLVAVAIALLATSVRQDAAQPLLASAALVAVIAIVVWIVEAIRRASIEAAVTDQRVIFKRGIISRHTIEIHRSKVESVDVDQTILGRVFGYGTVLVRGTGGSLEPMRNIADPLRFRSFITAG